MGTQSRETAGTHGVSRPLPFRVVTAADEALGSNAQDGTDSRDRDRGLPLELGHRSVGEA